MIVETCSMTMVNFLTVYLVLDCGDALCQGQQTGDGVFLGHQVEHVLRKFLLFKKPEQKSDLQRDHSNIRDGD